ncbi:MAG TPA: alanine racemase [Acidimicrobiales bacterium]|jgi:D-threonine aldolase|nr:alanine racemase [Acidimicrobiales bacterium]
MTTADVDGLEHVQTPALLIDQRAFEQNLATMAEALPGARMRPHVKAHKTTAIARRQAAHGHTTFTCATIREVELMAAAGLGDDLLLANEVVGEPVKRLGAAADAHNARITVAVDSEATIDAAVTGGVKEVLVDVNVGLPRCGCDPEDAGRIADAARARGLNVRGVMGYEGHVVGLPDREERIAKVGESMALLVRAAELVAADEGVISAGGTGTYDINTWANEIQAGSYALMDTHYGNLGLPFEQALTVLATVISVAPKGKYAVADCGLKALGMDHGNPTIPGARVWFCSDEHVTFAPENPVSVGDRVRVMPAHVDPTMAYHAVVHVVADGEGLADTWPIDMRGW